MLAMLTVCPVCNYSVDLPQCLHVTGRLYRRRLHDIAELQWTTRLASSHLVVADKSYM